MPLAKCPECNKDVSSQAATCPHCGHPLTHAGNSGATNFSQLSNAPSNPQKKMSKAKLGCLGFLAVIAIFILLAIIGSFLPDSAQNNIPKTVKVQSNQPDQIYFRQWQDVEDFNAELSQQIDALMGGKQITQLSDIEAAEIGKQSELKIRALKAKYGAEGRLWDIPAGTEIKISKYYDGKGNEIAPVWNEQQKMVYTPDGNSVYVAADWDGKTIYTMLTSQPQ